MIINLLINKWCQYKRNTISVKHSLFIHWNIHEDIAIHRRRLGCRGSGKMPASLPAALQGKVSFCPVLFFPGFMYYLESKLMKIIIYQFVPVETFWNVFFQSISYSLNTSLPFTKIANITASGSVHAAKKSPKRVPPRPPRLPRKGLYLHYSYSLEVFDVSIFDASSNCSTSWTGAV